MQRGIRSQTWKRLTMPRLAVVLSGPVGAGKTELARRLSGPLNAKVIRTRTVLEQEYHVHERAQTRGKLQLLGDQLDEETGGQWVANAVIRHTRYLRGREPAVIDAVRRDSQITALRDQFTTDVFHIHLTASDRVLRKRYAERQKKAGGKESPTFDDVRANPTEAAIGELRAAADQTINTGRWPSGATFARAYIRVLLHETWQARQSIINATLIGLAVVAFVVVAFFGFPALVVSGLARPWRSSRREGSTSGVRTLFHLRYAGASASYTEEANPSTQSRKGSRAKAFALDRADRNGVITLSQRSRASCRTRPKATRATQGRLVRALRSSRGYLEAGPWPARREGSLLIRDMSALRAS